MFKSFFPNPRYFFISVLVWISINTSLWFLGGNTWGEYLGFPKGYAETPLPVGVSRFWEPSSLWFYIWFFVATALFAGFWRFFSDNKWQRWSIWGSAFILFNIWFGVQVSVAINACSVHDKFHRTLVLSGFFFLKIASTFLNSSFFPKPIKRRIAI